jgi:hypothetical protein
VIKKLWHDPVWSKIISSALYAAFVGAAGIGAATYFHWWSAILTFLFGTFLVQRWLFGALLLGVLALLALRIDLALTRRKARRPRWFTWNELDWQLMGDFFVEGHNLKPELAGNLYVYIRGPFCRNPACKREVPIVALAAGKVFAHSVVVCPCVRTPIMIDFKREIIGISEERAVLVEACKEAQAASRRGERFRAS